MEPHNLYAPHQNHSHNEVNESAVGGAGSKYSGEYKYGILVAKSEGRRPLGSPERRWRNNIKKEILRDLLTYLLTPWGRVLLEKLTGSAASQEIPRILGTRSFLTVLTSARHLSLS